MSKLFLGPGMPKKEDMMDIYAYLMKLSSCKLIPPSILVLGVTLDLIYAIMHTKFRLVG